MIALNFDAVATDAPLCSLPCWNWNAHLVLGEVEALHACGGGDERGDALRLAVIRADVSQNQRPKVQQGTKAAAQGVEARPAALGEGVVR